MPREYRNNNSRRRRCCGSSAFCYYRAAVVFRIISSVAVVSADHVVQQPPQLNGAHFRITVVEERGFLHFDKDPDSGELSFSGYLIDMLAAVAREDRANFTYELRTPSGYGSMCRPQLSSNSSSTGTSDGDAYGETYYAQYDCATNDVNDDLPPLSNNRSTDIYLGAFYITPERQLINRFTIPYLPPYVGTLAMSGTATGLRTFEELVEQQKAGIQPPACVPQSAATGRHIKGSFPDIQLHYMSGRDNDIYRALSDGTCEIYIRDQPSARHFVMVHSKRGECLANGKPIGVIGEPMSYGPSHYSIGIANRLPRDVADTISYWMNILMSCNPVDPTGICPEGNFASFYKEHGGGTGRECGYVLFPTAAGSKLSPGAIAGVVLGSVLLVMILFTAWHFFKLREQERRYKKRFVQQIARNIEIGPSPGLISPEKIAQEVLHIGDDKGVINKEDLKKWMSDIKLTFISEKDFDALWNAMDINGTGEVDSVEFVVFLSACGPEFEEVYKEQQSMSKMERLKLAARRLENLAEGGEERVLKIERKLDRSSRTAVCPANKKEKQRHRPHADVSSSVRSLPAKGTAAGGGLFASSIKFLPRARSLDT